MIIFHQAAHTLNWRWTFAALAAPVAIVLAVGTESAAQAQSFDPLRDLRRSCEVLKRSGAEPGTEELRLFCPLLARADAENWPLERLFREMERARGEAREAGPREPAAPGGTFGELGLDRGSLEDRPDWRGGPGGSAERTSPEARGDEPAGPYDRPGEITNSWSSNRSSEFSHVLRGEPGPVTLVLEARTDMPGGQTVTAYRADTSGRRLRGAGLTVVATRAGNVRTAPWTIPVPARGEPHGAAHLVLEVTNHAGGHYSGNYRISIER